MLGFGDKHDNKIDPSTLPIFVHVLQSSEAFALAQKVWDTNARNLLLDQTNRKELLRFVFPQPPCVIWLQRDAGRLDTFELILMWESTDNDKPGVTEVYAVSPSQTVVGDDTRVKSLLQTILTTPSTVPSNQARLT